MEQPDPTTAKNHADKCFFAISITYRSPLTTAIHSMGEVAFNCSTMMLSTLMSAKVSKKSEITKRPVEYKNVKFSTTWWK